MCKVASQLQQMCFAVCYFIETNTVNMNSMIVCLHLKERERKRDGWIDRQINRSTETDCYSNVIIIHVF